MLKLQSDANFDKTFTHPHTLIKYTITKSHIHYQKSAEKSRTVKSLCKLSSLCSLASKQAFVLMKEITWILVGHQTSLRLILS